MKAITLWQPWASLMAIGVKQNETRHWLTHYRGELAICSAKKRDVNISLPLAAVLCREAEKLGVYGSNVTDIFDALPFGFVLCVGYLHDIRTTDWEVGRISQSERDCGNYEPGRFAWRMLMVRRLRNPVPVIGRQALFELPREVVEKVREQL